MRLDVVIPYRQSLSDELVYSLRSLKNIPHAQVFVVGDNPRLNVNYIYYRQTRDIAQNTLNILNIAIESPEVSKSFIWMADDMFILKPINRLPVYHRGLYSDIIQAYDDRHRQTFYTRRMRKTYEKLISMGIKDPLCYELHMPFVIDKFKWDEVGKFITPDVNKLSMYGNLAKIGGNKMDDVKARRGEYFKNDSFVSTHDGSFGSSEVGRVIRDMFPDKSPYEW